MFGNIPTKLIKKTKTNKVKLVTVFEENGQTKYVDVLLNDEKLDALFAAIYAVYNDKEKNKQEVKA